MRSTWKDSKVELDLPSSRKLSIHMENAKQGRSQRKNYNAIHARPLPLDVYPLPAFIPSNPLSYLRLFYALLSGYFAFTSSHPTIHKGYYSPATRSVHVTDGNSIRFLWERGFFGKGSLSRSEPEWLEGEKRRLGFAEEGNKTAGEVTNRRREERRQLKRERAKVEREELEEQLRKEGKFLDVSNSDVGTISISENQLTSRHGGIENYQVLKGSSNVNEAWENGFATARSPRQPPTSVLKDQEHLQISPHEAFFLAYGLGVLEVRKSPSSQSHALTTQDLFALFCRISKFPAKSVFEEISPDDPFIVNYVVYQYFRSLGWVIRPGIKFAVDWLLYARGPVFAHAEFAVVILPSYSRWVENTANAEGTTRTKEDTAWREKGEWWWFHAANRVQTQVMKSLMLCYVEIPTVDEVSQLNLNGDVNIGQLLKRYKIREFVIRRWSPNRNRDWKSNR